MGRRFFAHLHLAIDNANKYLFNRFIPEFNRLFGRTKSLISSVFASIDKVNISNYLSIISRRKIQEGCFISYKNKKYVIMNHKKERILLPKNTSCLVIKTFKNESLVNVDDNIYALELYQMNKKYINSYQKTSFHKHLVKRTIPKILKTKLCNI